jgi:SAM-dependent methyltransferase
VYGSKPSAELGWYQRIPQVSLSLIEKLDLPEDAPVVDIGGGDSRLCEQLLRRNFVDLSVLDISEKAMERSRGRLAGLANGVDWIVSDVLDFRPGRRYALWHDRACFHFLTSGSEVARYVELVRQSLRPGGALILGTFSEKGPERCSGLAVRRYDRTKLEKVFSDFRLKEFRYLDHHTPTGVRQNYIFCLFETKG